MYSFHMKAFKVIICGCECDLPGVPVFRIPGLKKRYTVITLNFKACSNFVDFHACF